MTTHTFKTFDCYEIGPCRRIELPDPPGGFDFEACEPDEADVWTLYGHISGEGAQSIGDFPNRNEAEEAFSRITGIPFATPREIMDRVQIMHAGPKLLAVLIAASGWIGAQVGRSRIEIQAKVRQAIAEATGISANNHCKGGAMATIAVKLTSVEAVRAACELSIAEGEAQVQVMYKSDNFEDDDYVGVDLEEFAGVLKGDESLEDFCGEGRHSWELWVYDEQDAGDYEATGRDS
jgi:hypothetical protein